jgi:hypothetical protein
MVKNLKPDDMVCFRGELRMWGIVVKTKNSAHETTHAQVAWMDLISRGHDVHFEDDFGKAHELELIIS